MENNNPIVAGQGNAQELQKNNEEVLIEIHGKFELVSATDMEAISSPFSSAKEPFHFSPPVYKEPFNSPPSDNKGSPLSPEEPSRSPSNEEPYNSPSSVEESMKSPPSVHSKEPTSSLPCESVQDIKIADAERVSIKNDDDSKNDNTHSGSRPNSNGSGLRSDVNAAGPKFTDDATNRDIIARRISQNVNPFSMSLSEIRKPAVGVNLTKISTKEIINPTRGRTKSAPGYRITHSEMEEEERRKQDNDVVYKAWLDKKNTKLSEERRLKVSHKIMTQEEMLMRKEQSRSAYESWVASKSKLDERKPKERSIKSATPFKESDVKKSSDAYNVWLEHKRLQIQKEQELKRRKLKEEGETARKVNSDIVHQAYQEWLLKKNIEAREMAAQRALYKRMFVRDARKLKETTENRFGGF